MQQSSLLSRLSELCVVDEFWYCQAIKRLMKQSAHDVSE
jgi:hypothetical protein